ncbi:MAG: hypothetical protein ACHQM6_11310 [Candidatus Kapaibacterium sp.]
MNEQTHVQAFFASDAAHALKEPEIVHGVIASFADDSPILYDLTFHAAFTKRIFDIIRREGPHTQGFDRMQQSFAESVEKIKAILKNLEAENPVVIADLISPTPEARAKLSRFIEDLALLKNWLLGHQIE